MNCLRLQHQCQCGNKVVPHILWITDTKCLLATCYCPVCHEDILVQFSLTELYKACPKPDKEAKPTLLTATPVSPVEFTLADKRLLKQMRITDEIQPSD